MLHRQDVWVVLAGGLEHVPTYSYLETLGILREF